MKFFNLLADIAPGVSPPVYTTPDNSSPAVKPVTIFLIVAAVVVVGIILLFMVHKAQKNKSKGDSKNNTDVFKAEPIIEAKEESTAEDEKSSSTSTRE